MPTYPGVNPSFALNAVPLAERQVIMRFAQQFYITRAPTAFKSETVMREVWEEVGEANGSGRQLAVFRTRAVPHWTTFIR